MERLGFMSAARGLCDPRTSDGRLFAFSWCRMALAGVIAVGLGLGVGTISQQMTETAPREGGTVTQATINPLAGPLDAVEGPSEGVLVMVQGMVDRRLVFWPVGSEGPALEIDRHVGLWPLLPSPDGRRLVYATPNSLLVFDVDTGRAAIVGHVPDEATVRNVQWSPDSRALAYSLDGPDQRATFITQADGRTNAIQMISVPAGLPVDVGWLADGRPVSIYIGIGPVGGLEARYLAFDPLTGEKSVLDDETHVIQPWAPWRSPEGAMQLYPLGDPADTQQTRVCLSGAMGMIGAEWLYLTTARIGEPEEVVFQVKSVFLDRPMWLSDGRVLMRGLPGTACDPAGMGIYLGELGTVTPEQIIQTPPVFDTTNSTALFTSLAYAVGPNEQVIAWTTHDLAKGQSAIHTMPVAGGEVDVIYETATLDGMGTPYAFQDSTLILYFVWLPGPTAELPIDPRAF